MIIQETALPGVLIIEPKVFRDDRGFFLEAFNEQRFAASGLPTTFRQDNHSRSLRNVLRGLHYQLRRPQGKLLTVVSGVVFDVAVDIRRGSPHFGQWFGATLSADKPQYIWIPPGFAHGFCVLSEAADFLYKCTELYVPEDEAGIAWNDPTLRIHWPIEKPLLSPKDSRYKTILDSATELPVFTNIHEHF